MDTNLFSMMQQEFGLTAIILIVLAQKALGTKSSPSGFLNLANGLLVINLVVSWMMPHYGVIFNGFFVSNPLVLLEKTILLGAFLFIVSHHYNWLKTHEHLEEFYLLLITTLLGMNFMLSSGNFLLFYLGLEMTAIPMAALVNFDMGKVKSSEGAMKMILSSAFSSGLFLYGVSLLYGITGTLSISSCINWPAEGNLHFIALLLIFSGFAFKLSAVPFHFWTADVYEGAPLAITAYLSVVSKAAMVFVFISVLTPLFQHFEVLYNHLMVVTILLTITIGNLFAMRQENLKRFMAFSSIAQVGYVLMGLFANGQNGNTAVLYFLLVYIVSNLTVFGALGVAFEMNGSEQLKSLSGLYKRNPVLAWLLAIGLFSLAGVPPTAGFFGKMFLVTAGAAKGNYWLVGIAAANMVVSLYYYLRIVRTIFMEEEVVVDGTGGAALGVTGVGSTGVGSEGFNANKQGNLALYSLPGKIAFGIGIIGIVGLGIFSGAYTFIESFFIH